MLQDKLYLGSRNVVTHRYYDQRLDPGTSTLTRTFVSVLLYSLELLLIRDTNYFITMIWDTFRLRRTSYRHKQKYQT